MEPIRSHRAATAPPSDGRPRPAPETAVPIYPPREDSELLLPFARVAAGTWFLEVGAGTGLAAIEASRRGAFAVATDLNPYALARLYRRAREEALHLELVRTDLARGLGRFDRVLANPPYLPTTPAERDPDPWHNLALDGGPDGCRVTGRLIGELGDHLRPGGEAYVLVSSLQDPRALARIRDDWVARGGDVRVEASRDLEGERLDVWRLRPKPVQV